MKKATDIVSRQFGVFIPVVMLSFTMWKDYKRFLDISSPILGAQICSMRER